MKKIFTVKNCSNVILLVFFLYSCSKSGGDNTPSDPCTGITVVVNATVVNPTIVGGTNGSLTATATGGTGFQYSLNGGSFQTSGTFNALAAGTYTIVAKNTNGCTGTNTFTVTNPSDPCSGITITVTGVTSNPTTVGGANGSIVASGSGSTGFTYSINGGSFQANGNFNGLLAGAYTITAKDVNGCTGSSNFTLTDPNPCSGITIIVSAITTNPTVVGGNNGSITANATGSTGFTYSLNNGLFQASGIFNGLTAGTFTITAKDLNGCTGTGTFTLTDPNPCAGITISVINTIVNNTPCLSNNGMITSTASGGNGTYNFSLNGGVFQASNSFPNLAPGFYTVVAKDVNNCSGSSGATEIINLPAGPLFTQVKQVLQNNCVTCHNNTQMEGGMNWTIDCNIVSFRDRIQARAVNANPSAMPPTGLLPSTERQKIIDWINAGGKYTD